MGAAPLLQLVRLVVTTQGTEVSGEGVLLELAGLFVVAQPAQVAG
jgi:hypothetical protein